MELLPQLEAYYPLVICPAEKLSVLRCIRFLQSTSLPFHRETLEGHITASAFVVSNDFSQVVLLHHTKLTRWLQPGGHCDGQTNTYQVARKEAQEETGLTTLEGQDFIFDVDVHWIPMRKDIPGHWHFDIRYLFVVNPADESLRKNEESNQVRWIHGNEINKFTQEASILRMWSKLREKNLPS